MEREKLRYSPTYLNDPSIETNQYFSKWYLIMYMFQSCEESSFKNVVFFFKQNVVYVQEHLIILPIKHSPSHYSLIPEDAHVMSDTWGHYLASPGVPEKLLVLSSNPE